MWKKTMDYLGLGPDEAYDDYDVDDDAELDEGEVEIGGAVEQTRPVFPSRGDTGPIRRPSTDDPSVKVRTVRPSPRNAEPVTVRPRGFEQAQEVADAFKVGQPVKLKTLYDAHKDRRRDLNREGCTWWQSPGNRRLECEHPLKNQYLPSYELVTGSIVEVMSEVRDGKKRIREEKLYPGYFFMEMQLVEEIWYLLRDTPGVGDFVGGGSKPIPMVASEVKKLLDIIEERERDEPPEVKIEVDKNDTVKITDGPFENFEGVVEEVHPGKGQVRVMVTIFGRETPVDLEYWQVEKV